MSRHRLDHNGAVILDHEIKARASFELEGGRERPWEWSPGPFVVKVASGIGGVSLLPEYTLLDRKENGQIESFLEGRRKRRNSQTEERSQREDKRRRQGLAPRRWRGGVQVRLDDRREHLERAWCSRLPS